MILVVDGPTHTSILVVGRWFYTNILLQNDFHLSSTPSHTLWKTRVGDFHSKLVSFRVQPDKLSFIICVAGGGRRCLELVLSDFRPPSPLVDPIFTQYHSKLSSRIAMEALFYSAIVMFTLISLNLSVVLREYPPLWVIFTPI